MEVMIECWRRNGMRLLKLDLNLEYLNMIIKVDFKFYFQEIEKISVSSEKKFKTKQRTSGQRLSRRKGMGWSLLSSTHCSQETVTKLWFW